jgi:WD40 repeat protein
LSVALSPDGRLLATGDTDNKIHVWRVADEQLLFTCEGHTNWVRAVAFSPDGKILASGSTDPTVRLWDTPIGYGHFLSVQIAKFLLVAVMTKS